MSEQREVREHDSSFAQAVAELCRRERHACATESGGAFGSHPLWRAIRETGSALWLDSGDIDANRKVWTREFSAFTTNNTLLNKEVQKGMYDELVPRAAAEMRRADPSISQDDMVLELAFVLNVVHALRLAHEFDADVSVELHTGVTRDAGASYQYGKRVHAICPDRFLVKIALTPEGLIAARRLEADGVPVNFTLGFSARQNYLIARYAHPHFVNVFLGRINSFVEETGREIPDGVGEAATIASQQMLRKLIGDALVPDHTRQIAASMRGGAQVASLAGVDVLTMPVSTARDFTEADISPEKIADATRADPTEALREVPAAERVDVFWEVKDPTIAAAAQLVARHPDTMTGDRLRAILKDNFLGDLFPDLSEEEAERVARGGKLPSWRAWHERVADGTASWDGLLTEAGLASFAADQAALDDRIRGLL